MKAMKERNKKARAILNYCRRKIMNRVRRNLATMPEPSADSSVRMAYQNLYGSEAMLYTYCFDKATNETSPL